MIDELKMMIDEAEGNPKIKKILLKIAEMPEHKQADTIKLVRLMLGSS